MTASAPPEPRQIAPDSPPPPAPVDRPTRRWRELLGPAAFEASFVVLGVILAYATNEWREARVHRRDAATARMAIVTELRGNRTRLEQSLAYHRELMDTIFRRPVSAPPLSAGFFRRGFIAPAAISTTAWKVAAETGALSHMPYSEVLAISEIYGPLERYEAQAMNAGQFMYGELFRAGPTGVAAQATQLGAIIGAFGYREAELIARLDAVFSRLGVTASIEQQSPRQ